MSWYYADNNERRGPIESPAFEELVRNGTIKPETLVWREGMPNWLPYGQVSGAAGAGTPAGAIPTGAAGGVRCSSCGNLFPASDIITIAGRAVCATCKPRVVQQMVEGADAGGAGIVPAKLLADMRARGGYRIDIGSVLSRAWAVVKRNLGPCIGTTLLVYLVIMVAQQCLSIIGQCLVMGPAFGGLFLYFLKQLRGQPAIVGDAFVGFNKPHYGQLALAGTVQALTGGLIAAILIVPAAIFYSARISENEFPFGFIAWCIVASLPLIYLTICWILSFAFIIDQRLRFWDAMELSRKLVNMNLGGWIILMIVNFLLAMAGVLAVCLGLLFVMPVLVCSLMVIYEDILAASNAAAA
jgi:hypothetical protein